MFLSHVKRHHRALQCLHLTRALKYFRHSCFLWLVHYITAGISLRVLVVVSYALMQWCGNNNDLMF